MTTISFEVFPPRSVEQSFRLWDCLGALAPLGPDFVSVTYGAGGTTRGPTLEAVGAIRRLTGLRVAGHLTCVGQSRAETLAVADAYAEAGLRDVVALRGDAPGGAAFAPHPEGFAGSDELVAALAGRFRVLVGAYPERHPAAASEAADIEHLKRKAAAGAALAITQFFFRADTFLRFRDRCDRAGLGIPVVPGILPVANWTGARRMAERCGASVPPNLAAGFARAESDGIVPLLGLAVATALCERLLAEGVGHLHVYTLNRPDLARDLCLALGLGARAPAARVA